MKKNIQRSWKTTGECGITKVNGRRRVVGRVEHYREAKGDADEEVS